MTTKRWFYDTVLQELFTVHTGKDGAEFFQSGDLIGSEVEEVVYSDPDKIEVTSDNADLFIDTVIELQNQAVREAERLEAIYNILEGILD